MNPRVNTEPSLTPDTPRERELRKQVNDLHEKVAHLRATFAEQLLNMRTNKEKHERHGPELDEARGALARQRVQVAKLEEARKHDELERKVLESRVAAGAERRKDAMITLVALLRCEDDHMDDAEWERRMDTVIRHARRIVTAERTAAVVHGGQKP